MLTRPLLVAVALVLAGCAGQGATTTTSDGTTPTTAVTSTTLAGATTTTAPSGEAGFPVTVTAANGDVTIETRPERIVSLSPTATEILFAIGGGDQVVAVDSFSYYPEQAPVTDLSGFEPNLEAIASYEPDLVVVSDDINDVVAGLDALGVAVLHQPAAGNLDDTYAQIEQLGAATGNAADAAALVDSLQSEVESLVADAPEPAEPLTFYHELDPTYFSVTSDTFIGQVYALVGLVNIADEAEGADTFYPQLSAEYVIDADPDLIFLADTKCCGESVETVAARPGWDQITAVQTGNVVPLDDDIASRWGPRVVDFLEVVVEAANSAAGP